MTTPCLPGRAPVAPASRRRAAACAILGPIFLVLGATPATATLGPPVKVRLLGEPAPAVAGQPWHGRVEITTGAAAELSEFRLEGDGWQPLSLSAPATMRLDKQQAHTLEISARPGDPERPLVLSFRFGDRIVQKSLDLSAANAGRAYRPGKLSPVEPDPATAPAPAGGDDGPGPILAADARNPVPDADKAGRWIRVRGRFVYYREDGPWVGADHATVKIHDTSMLLDQTLAETTTDFHGWFDASFYWNPCGICAGQPDLHVEFIAQNDRVRVEDATWEMVYKWSTSTWDGYTGSDLNVGSLAPENPADYPGLHVLTNVTRSWRWLLHRQVYDCPALDVQWPDGENDAYYVSFFQEIHLSSGRQWQEGTMAHEYGHHWMHTFSVSATPDYCNGICDGAWPDCGHCLWCPENASIAWTEAFPNYFGHLIPGSYEADYHLAANNVHDFERLRQCRSPTPEYWGDPVTTEGFASALLQDISDAAQDSDPHFPGQVDSLAVGPGPLFVCIDLDHPLNVLDFLNKFKARYAGWAVPIWKTAKNCGYEIDQLPPNMVTGLISTSHTANLESPDPTVDFTWNYPWDDASGVAGYAVSITAGPQTPPSVMTIGDVQSYTTPTLPPGTHYLNIRPVDRAGRWAIAATSFGPLVIRAAEPSNLAYRPLAGWGHVVVPRGAMDASFASCPAPATLPGNAASTYWNVSGENTGDVATSTSFLVHAHVDGAYVYPWGYGVVLPGHAGFYANNMGPLTVRGGRHVLESRLDATDRIAELDEADNRWARQWVWTPLAITVGAPVTRAAPPLRTAGWEAVTDGSLLAYNCDGLRFTSSGWWNALTVRATSNADDYDLRLHAPSSGAADGFAGYAADSDFGAGYLDAVFVNRNLMGSTSWDVGIVNYRGAGSYVATHVASTSFVFGDSLTVPFAEGEAMRLWEVAIPPVAVGPVSVTVGVGTASLPVTALWLDRLYEVGGLDSDAPRASTDATGRLRIDVTPAGPGYFALAVYRDPISGLAPVAVTVEIEATPPDLAPHWAAGWHAPLVPRRFPDGTPSAVEAPDSLRGNVAATYFNLAVRNASPAPAPASEAMICLDGVRLSTLAEPPLAPGGVSLINLATALTVRGGRHTVALRLDEDLRLHELGESNNSYGEQYAWSPFRLRSGEPVTRAAPPSSFGGWEDVGGGQALYYNCDGLRYDFSGSGWQAAAVMPLDDSAVDIRLYHPRLRGAQDGFATPVAWSAWSRGRSDFVLTNVRSVGGTSADVGVTSPAAEGPGYVAQNVASERLDPGPNGDCGAFVLPAGHLLHLHEFVLGPGPRRILLLDGGGEVDWGISLYADAANFLGKSGAVPSGIAYRNGPGQDESLEVLLDGGRYCLAVWKVGSPDLEREGRYRLNVVAGATDVPELPPPGAATAIVAIHPNPFNPQTRIVFDLAHPGGAGLAIYDLQGRRLRVLVDAGLPAGRHEAVWDGRDDEGQPVASGVYMTRLEAGSVRQMRKMVLLK